MAAGWATSSKDSHSARENAMDSAGQARVPQDRDRNGQKFTASVSSMSCTGEASPIFLATSSARVRDGFGAHSPTARPTLLDLLCHRGPGSRDRDDERG